MGLQSKDLTTACMVNAGQGLTVSCALSVRYSSAAEVEHLESCRLSAGHGTCYDSHDSHDCDQRGISLCQQKVSVWTGQWLCAGQACTLTEDII